MEVFILFAGAMAFAVTMAVIVGRWITAEMTWLGVLVRTVLLAALYAFGLTHFGTVWFFVAAALAPLPLVDAVWRDRLATAWVRECRRERAAEAVRDAVRDPASATVRLRLGRALLEEGRIELGLEALAAAAEMAPADSKLMMERMAEEARQEFIHTCPSCRKPNPLAALACRHCLAPLSDSQALRLAVWCCRPAVRFLRS